MMVATSVVLPMPLRPSTASAPPSASVKRDIGQHDRLAVAGGQSVDAQELSHAGLAEIDLAHARIGGDLGGRAFDQHRAVHQHGDALGEAEHHVHVVLDQQHGHARAATRHGGEDVVALAPPGTPAAGSSSSSTRGAQRQRERDLQQPLLAVGQIAVGAHDARAATSRSKTPPLPSITAPRLPMRRQHLRGRSPRRRRRRAPIVFSGVRPGKS